MIATVGIYTTMALVGLFGLALAGGRWAENSRLRREQAEAAKHWRPAP